MPVQKHLITNSCSRDSLLPPPRPSLVANDVLMSLLSSFIIDPVVRQARRFSGAAPQGEGPLSHANAGSPIAPPAAALLEDDASGVVPPRVEGIPQAPEGQSAVLIDRAQPYSPFIGRLRSTVVDDAEGQDENDGRVQEGPLSFSRPQLTASSAPIDIPADVGMSSNPDRSLEAHFRRLNLEPPLSSTPANTATQSQGSASSGAGDQNGPTMSESLPADDGMRHLRARIHQIRDLRVADSDKARMMHSLMTERYNFLRPQSPSSFVSNDRPFTPTSGQSIFSDAQLSSPISTASEVDPENPFNLHPGDTNPMFRIRSSHQNSDHAGEDDDFDTAEDGSSLGCQHYKRNVKVQCFQCRRWYTCRHCHDAVEDHNLNRRKTQNMLCMVCGTPQSAGEYCSQCSTRAAWYYCDICKLWDDNSSKKIYHCMDCGICRKGEGLGKDYIHCKVS